MIAQLLLSFRESLEATLLVTIIFTYLQRMKRKSVVKYIWYGVSVAVIFSIGVGSMVWLLFGYLDEVTKTLFEGVASILAAVVLSTMIYWMATKGNTLKTEIEDKVKGLMAGRMTFLFAFSFIIVFREGFETVLFLTPYLIHDLLSTIVGVILGVVMSIIISYLIFIIGLKISIRGFFYFTSILLVLIGGGLIGHSMHELIEYSEHVGVDFGWVGRSAYNLNLSTDDIFYEKSFIGSILTVFFGYTTSAEWLRLIAHAAYLGIFFPLTVIVFKKKN